MKRVLQVLSVAALLLGAGVAYAVDGSPRVAAPSTTTTAATIPERVMGDPKAPVTVEEYVSLTCSHCAEFYTTTLPDLEKKYVDTGKVKFILRDFPLDGTALKAAALARCMPADEYYPFIKVLYGSQATWAFGTDPDHYLIQYATLGGLSADKAKACIADTGMQNALIAARQDASDKHKIEATPTFIINNDAERIQGAQPAETFSAVFDRLLAAKQ